MTESARMHGFGCWWRRRWREASATHKPRNWPNSTQASSSWRCWRRLGASPNCRARLTLGRRRTTPPRPRGRGLRTSNRPPEAQRPKPGPRWGTPARAAGAPRIDRREEHRLEVCPGCGGALQRCKRTRTRTIEDILADLRTEVAEHTIHRDYCPACKKHVEPVVPDALPNATSAIAWWPDRLAALRPGRDHSQVQELLGNHLQTPSAGGLISMWHRLGEILTPWYEQIADAARLGRPARRRDRLAGQRPDLLAVVLRQPDACYYLIDRSRGGPAWRSSSPRPSTACWCMTSGRPTTPSRPEDRQCCLAHLLRELEKVDLTNASAAVEGLRQATAAAGAGRHPPAEAGGLHAGQVRRTDPADRPAADGPGPRRLCRRRRHAPGRAAAASTATSLFTFLDHPDVPYDNNLAERMIRPAVILRKNSQSNR